MGGGESTYLLAPLTPSFPVPAANPLPWSGGDPRGFLQRVLGLRLSREHQGRRLLCSYTRPSRRGTEDPTVRSPLTPAPNRAPRTAFLGFRATQSPEGQAVPARPWPGAAGLWPRRAPQGWVLAGEARAGDLVATSWPRPGSRCPRVTFETCGAPEAPLRCDDWACPAAGGALPVLLKGGWSAWPWGPGPVSPAPGLPWPLLHRPGERGDPCRLAANGRAPGGCTRAAGNHQGGGPIALRLGGDVEMGRNRRTETLSPRASSWGFPAPAWIAAGARGSPQPGHSRRPPAPPRALACGWRLCLPRKRGHIFPGNSGVWRNVVVSLLKVPGT